VLSAPVLRELVEPFIEGGDEVTPLDDRQRLGLGQGTRDERRRQHRSGARGGESKSRAPQKSRRVTCRRPLFPPDGCMDASCWNGGALAATARSPKTKAAKCAIHPGGVLFAGLILRKV